MSTLQALSDVLTQYGRFNELYMDRGSHHFPYENTKQHQLTRVLKALHIKPIYARSPQGRGRCERAFGTIQGRLPQELRLARVTTIDQANQFLQSTFIDDFNRCFAVPPADADTDFVPVRFIEDLPLLLSVQHRRCVRNDFTVHFQGRTLQLHKQAPVSPKARVLVHRMLDHHHLVSHQGNRIATFQPDGTPHQAVGCNHAPAPPTLPTYLNQSLPPLPWGGHLY